MKATKAYVVGGGLFGSMAARALQDKGYDVTVFDCRKSFRGSRPAGCVMKPSWMTSLDYAEPMKYLDKTYGVIPIDFKVVGPIKASCFRIDPVKVLGDESLTYVRETVTEVRDGSVTTPSGTYKGLVVVAAGVWSETLLKGRIPEIRALTGCAILGTGVVKTPTIHVYAPYRQAVFFSRERNETWFGDGTAIIAKNYTEDHTVKSVQRAKDLANIVGDPLVGYRPYIKGKNNGLFEKLGNNLFVMTGGAKNGTILAASQTLQLLRSI